MIWVLYVCATLQNSAQFKKIHKNEGIESGVIKQNVNIVQTTFAMWGMLTGVIQLSFNKKEYITQMIHMQQKEFLDRSFELLYKAIRKEE